MELFEGLGRTSNMDLDPVFSASGQIPFDWIKASPADQLRQLRGALYLSQRQLADSAGVSAAVICRLERGADARLSTWRKIFEAMGYWAVIMPAAFAEESEDLIMEERDRRWGRQQEALRKGNNGRRR